MKLLELFKNKETKHELVNLTEDLKVKSECLTNNAFLSLTLGQDGYTEEEIGVFVKKYELLPSGEQVTRLVAYDKYKGVQLTVLVNDKVKGVHSLSSEPYNNKELFYSLLVPRIKYLESVILNGFEKYSTLENFLLTKYNMRVDYVEGHTEAQYSNSLGVIVKVNTGIRRVVTVKHLEERLGELKYVSSNPRSIVEVAEERFIIGQYLLIMIQRHEKRNKEENGYEA